MDQREDGIKALIPYMVCNSKLCTYVILVLHVHVKVHCKMYSVPLHVQSTYDTTYTSIDKNI